MTPSEMRAEAEKTFGISVMERAEGGGAVIDTICELWLALADLSEKFEDHTHSTGIFGGVGDPIITEKGAVIGGKE